ncbi:MAG: 2-amino-4-hydroxy-6-hydroxymethyldihydropteridine diphosphokinase [Phycisphaerales bacterium]|nr:MAG: 2-amino-4-hydroxy-6-hydroxymethyldihydropteridine diphosphokinase [Phycisphaerales bacterium]
MAEWTTAYIGLGSNLGDRERVMREALQSLGRNGAMEVLRVSTIKETMPLGQTSQPRYLNGVAEIRTMLSAAELLDALLTTEETLGRVRRGTWGPRTIDLDLLLFGDEIIGLPDLIVPHPQMHLRSFVLEGLCELDRDLVHPLFNEPVCELARRLGGGSFTLDPLVPQLVSIAGLIGVGKTTLMNRLATALDAETVVEPYASNPFLPRVYAGQRELALDSQLYFLVHRGEQLNARTLPVDDVTLADYVFEKELIYARRLLEPDQLALYERIYEPFAQRVARPVAVIYLQDEPGRCLERIHQRNRPYEQEITLEFLASLNADYEQLFAHWTACPIIRLPASQVHPDDQAALEHVALQVKAYVASRGQVAVG